MDAPIIQLAMAGIRQSVMSHMMAHHAEYNEIVRQALASTLSEKWVKKEVQAAVNKTIQEAINNLGDNWHLKSAVTDALSAALTQMINRNATPPTEEPSQ